MWRSRWCAWAWGWARSRRPWISRRGWPTSRRSATVPDRGRRSTNVGGDLDDLTRNYRAAFLRYLPQRSEAAMTTGYQLGRDAVVAGISLLDLTQVHHEVLAEVLEDTPAQEAASVTAAASDFLLEVL